MTHQKENQITGRGRGGGVGQAKNLMIEYQERGYGASDALVCYECVGDYYLKEYISDRGSQATCDYCGMSRKKCIGLEDLMNPIMDGILSEYEDATGCMGWDGREGGFLGAETWDSWDLVHDELWDEIGAESSTLLADIADLINSGITWCYRDPYSLREDDEQYFTWKSFCEQLKNDVRYVFFMAPPCEDDYNGKHYRPSDILEKIGESISDLNLVTTLPENERFYRGRMHNQSEHVGDARTLGPPPDKARSGRMNPEGISVFYAALDEMTALKEIYNGRKSQATIGTFYNLRKLNVIDISGIPSTPLPSLFDIEKKAERTSLLFLKKFTDEITSHVNDDDMLAYIPTQVVAEYFRHVFRTDNGRQKIDGIIYPSSINKGGKCIVLFYDSTHCSDDKDKILWLDKSSLRHIETSSIKLEVVEK